MSCCLTGRAATSPWWEKVKTSRRREVVICLQTKPASAAAQRRTRLVVAARGREGCSVRKVNMTISLAFLAPDLVKAAIDGRLPHGMGVARLCDLLAEWSRQRQMLGQAAL